MHSRDNGYIGPVSSVAAGHSHSVALTDAGQVWTWGLGSSGQLGNAAIAATIAQRPGLPVGTNQPSPVLSLDPSALDMQDRWVFYTHLSVYGINQRAEALGIELCQSGCHGTFVYYWIINLETGLSSMCEARHCFPFQALHSLLEPECTIGARSFPWRSSHLVWAQPTMCSIL